MEQNQLRELLAAVQGGGLSVDDALGRLRHLPFEDLGFARVDHHRALRVGMSEVIFGHGKTPEQVAEIGAALLARSSNLLVTRAAPEAAARLRERFPEAEYFPVSRVLRVWRDRAVRGKGPLLVVSAGTSDLPVSEEAFLTAQTMGSDAELVQDVGVAGLHRLLAVRDRLMAARVIVAVAGMEAALPSVIGGLVGCPVIGVPTSVGYGAHFQGLAALLGMLNSCASTVTVVNIDNGFGGGYVASLIAR